MRGVGCSLTKLCGRIKETWSFFVADEGRAARGPQRSPLSRRAPPRRPARLETKRPLSDEGLLAAVLPIIKFLQFICVYPLCGSFANSRNQKSLPLSGSMLFKSILNIPFFFIFSSTFLTHPSKHNFFHKKQTCKMLISTNLSSEKLLLFLF